MLARDGDGPDRVAVTAAARRSPWWSCSRPAMPPWAADEMRRHDWRMIIEAGHSISTYSARRWIGEVDVPTAIVCTTEDRGVAPSLQLALADAIPGATVHSIADGHLACANTGFADPLVAACLDVAGRVRCTRGRDVSNAPRPPRPTSADARAAPTARAPSPRTIERSESKSEKANTMWPTITTSSAIEDPVVHERRAGRQLSGNGPNQRMIDPVMSITTIAAPTNIALSF